MTPLSGGSVADAGARLTHELDQLRAERSHMRHAPLGRAIGPWAPISFDLRRAAA